jgi:hypothetical protein
MREHVCCVCDVLMCGFNARVGGWGGWGVGGLRGNLAGTEP